MRQVFQSHSGEDVIIKIDNWYITFRLPERNVGTVYDIEVDEWGDKMTNHLMQKNWFTREMADWIDEQIKK